MRPTDFLAFLSGQELMIVGVLVLVLFGGAKIPQLMRGLGRGMGEFKAGLQEGKEAMDKSLEG
ncbi:MAG: twin-arginine translocase TatA/TatE family subunit [Armatimonadetes bacterium]|nr:twin-arginine translocase TatA/TatE family subunit [Armatimonadota bacterium]